MRLGKLRLENFKGVELFEHDFGGKDALMVGDNATGKTTTADGFFWLLFEKDSNNSAEFDVKPNDAEGKEKHQLVTAVEAVLDGVTFRRELHEKWSSDRGKAEKKLTGHETAYYIDGVPIKLKKDFDAKIAELCDPVVFRTLTDTSYFAETMKWPERKKILALLAGVGTEEINRLENEKDVVKASEDKLKDNIKTTETELKEAKRKLPEIPLVSPAEKKADAEIRLHEINSKIADIKNGGAVVELRKQIGTLENEKADIERAETKAYNAACGMRGSRINELTAKLNAVKREHKNNQDEITTEQNKLKKIFADIEKLGVDYDKELEKQFNYAENCPTCGQAMPNSIVNEARAKWNTNHAQNLTNIDAEGGRLAEITDAKKAYILECEKNIETLTFSIAEIEKELKAIPEIEKPELNTARITAIDHQIKELLFDIANEDASKKVLLDAHESIKAGLEAAIKEMRIEEAKVIAAKDNFDRVSELEKQNKDLAQRKADIEQKLDEIKTKQKIIAADIEGKINGKFKTVEFSLFDFLINGELKMQCVPMIEGPTGKAPFSSANTAARINAGLDIINVLGEHFGKFPPVFVDHAESITAIIETKAQQIKLFKKQLPIEVDTFFQCSVCGQKYPLYKDAKACCPGITIKQLEA